MGPVQSVLLAGCLYAVVGSAALGLLMHRHGRDRLGPADRVTLVRAVLVGGVLVLAVADSSRPVPALATGAVLACALALDWVDGRVARQTGTASAFGARFDMEVDALLILVLSGYVAADVGWWVLSLGLARYVFAVLVRLVPRLQFEPPPRPWCKTVAVLVAVVLAAAAVGLLRGPLETVLLGVVAVLLAESFAHEAADRWRVGGQVRSVVLMLGGGARG